MGLVLIRRWVYFGPGTCRNGPIVGLMFVRGGPIAGLACRGRLIGALRL